MIHAGDTIENPVTGERIVFLQTARETAGEAVLVEVTVKPRGTVAAAHVHPYQLERFEVLEGLLAFRVAGRRIEGRPGDVLTVEPGQAHRFWNAGDEPARFRCTVRPALRFAQLIETMFGLAADGKTNKKGMPNPLRLAVIAKEHFDDVRLPLVPAWMQRTALAIGAPMGRLLGYGPTYESEPQRPALANA